MDFEINNIQSQKGKIAIVTGANNGIGYETTLGLGKTGAKVIMACRNKQKAVTAKESILKKFPLVDLKVMELDLSNFDSIANFAEQFKLKYNKLDILINNAGILDYSQNRNKNGIDLQFATNYLGHFFLTAKLIKLMPDSDASRIISLSSVAHKTGKINFDDINCENQADKGMAYAQSKLACLMFGDELNRRLKAKGKSIKSISVHPGGSDSGLFDDMSRVRYIILKILAPFITHSNKKAAIPSLYAALSNDAKAGLYYGPTGFGELKGKLGIAKRTEYSKNQEVAKKLWDLSEEMTNIKFII